MRRDEYSMQMYKETLFRQIRRYLDSMLGELSKSFHDVHHERLHEIYCGMKFLAGVQRTQHVEIMPDLRTLASQMGHEMGHSNAEAPDTEIM
jgi:hypothetical protein